MAKILYGPAIAEARGSVAGTTFSRNTYGAYMRNKTSPTQPQSPRQQTVRALFTQVSQYWRDTLVGSERMAWEDYAAQTPLSDVFGNKQILKGNAMFCRFNVRWMDMGNAILVNAPATPGEAPAMIVTLAGTAAAGITITAFSPTLLTADYISVLQAAEPVAPSRNFFNGPFKHCTSFLGDATPPIMTIGPSGSQVGQRWFFQIRAFEAVGRVGPPILAKFDVTS